MRNISEIYLTIEITIYVISGVIYFFINLLKYGKLAVSKSDEIGTISTSALRLEYVSLTFSENFQNISENL